MKMRPWMSTAKWFLVSWAFVYLLLDNVSLAFQRARVARQLQRLQTLDMDQQRVLAEIEPRHARMKRRDLRDRASHKRLSTMMAWAQTPDDLVVRSGERYVCQVVRDSDSHMRLLLFIPHVNRKVQADHKIKFAFREAWGPERSAKSKEFEADDPTTWETATTLSGVKPGLNQIDVVMNDQENESRLDIFVNQTANLDGTKNVDAANATPVHSYPMKPFRCVGCSYGPVFQYAFPNQVKASVSAKPRMRLGNVNSSTANYSVSLNELVRRTFNLESKPDGNRLGDLTVRCWLESANHPCISANHVAATFPEPAKYLFESSTPSLDDIYELLDTCDDWGRLELKKHSPIIRASD